MNAVKSTILVILFILGPGLFMLGSEPGLWANETEAPGVGASPEEQDDQLMDHSPGMIPSMDRILPYYDIIQHTLRYRLMDFQSLKETDSPAADFGPSALSRPLKGISCFEDGRAMTFEVIQSKLERKEIFISFHLTFHPRDHRMFLEMALTPFPEADISFWLPFLRNR